MTGNALQRVARNAHDMTVADVYEVVRALVTALTQITSRDVADIGGPLCLARDQLRKMLRRKVHRLPGHELQVTATGRRMRALAIGWGDWAPEYEITLYEVTGLLDDVLDAAGYRVPGMWPAHEAAARAVRSPGLRSAS